MSQIAELVDRIREVGYTETSGFLRTRQDRVHNLMVFLEDNPGALEAIENWIEENYPEEEDEEEEED